MYPQSRCVTKPNWAQVEFGLNAKEPSRSLVELSLSHLELGLNLGIWMDLWLPNYLKDPTWKILVLKPNYNRLQVQMFPYLSDMFKSKKYEIKYFSNIIINICSKYHISIIAYKYGYNRKLGIDAQLHSWIADRYS